MPFNFTFGGEYSEDKIATATEEAKIIMNLLLLAPCPKLRVLLVNKPNKLNSGSLLDSFPLLIH